MICQTLTHLDRLPISAIHEIHSCRTAQGFERIYAPGEKEFRSQVAYRRDGIPLNDVTLRDGAVFAVVQEQLPENRRHARQGLRGARYLLQGLLCCAHCGYAYYSKAISPSTRKHHPRHYAYYRRLARTS